MHMNNLLYVYFSNDSPCNISKCNFVIFFIPKGGDIWVVFFFAEKQFLFNILDKFHWICLNAFCFGLFCLWSLTRENLSSVFAK